MSPPIRTSGSRRVASGAYDPKDNLPSPAIVASLAASTLFAAAFCFDIPSALHDQIRGYFENTKYSAHFEYYFESTYICYSMPNIVLPVIGGALADRFGYRQAVILCAVLVSLGQFIMYVGFLRSDFILM